MVYTVVYTNGDDKMDTAKLFKNGRSQAVRLPKEYALSGKEVYIKRINGVVILIPKIRIINGFNLAFTSDDYANMPFEFTVYDMVSTDTFFTDFATQSAKIIKQ